MISITSSSDEETESNLSKTSADAQRRYYEVSVSHSHVTSHSLLFLKVYFTCFVGTFWTSKYQLSEGDFIIVQADRGHDIGVVNHLLHSDEIPIHQSTDGTNEIISVVPKDEFPVRAMLQDKVIAQNQALEICRNKCVELLISSQIEIIATEFQFDRKKLTLYYKKHSDVSVCKLIRKLYNIFKMRIWMEPIDVELSNDSFGDITTKFLSLGQITIPAQEKLSTNPSEYFPVFAASNSTANATVGTPSNIPIGPTASSVPKKENGETLFVEKPEMRSSPNEASRREQFVILSHEKGGLQPPPKSANPPRHLYQHTPLAHSVAAAPPAAVVQPPHQYYKHQYQPRASAQQQTQQYQQRGAPPPGYSSYSAPMSKPRGPPIAPTLPSNHNQQYDYDRNYVRDPAFNYREEYSAAPLYYDYDSTPVGHQLRSAAHTAYRHEPTSLSTRQERIDHYVDMIGAGPSLGSAGGIGATLEEDPYYQYHHQQQQQPSRNHYSKYPQGAGPSYQDGNFHPRSSYVASPGRRQNDDPGRFLPNGLYEDDSLVMSASKESVYEYSNFMPQSKSSFATYDYHSQF
jgi:hypothetical protein